MGKIINLSQAQCSKLSFQGAVERLSKGDTNGFKIKAYTGAPVNRQWGKLAIDVEGITAKQQIPILLNHNPGEIVGHSVRTYVEDGAFWVEGKFSGATVEASEAKKLLAEGFPWQASVGISPSWVESIGDSETKRVNGQEITGPAELWLSSMVFETSFVPLGADSNTSISTFSKGNNMTDSARSEWDVNPAIREEFGDFETYKAYLDATDRGLVKRISKETPGTQLTKITGTDPKTQWLGSPALRAEFFNDFEAFEAFCKNQHLVKISGEGCHA